MSEIQSAKALHDMCEKEWFQQSDVEEPTSNR